MSSFAEKNLSERLDALLADDFGSVNHLLKTATHVADFDCAQQPWGKVVADLRAAGFEENVFYEKNPNFNGEQRDYFTDSEDALLLKARSGVWKNGAGDPHDLYVGLVSNSLAEKELTHFKYSHRLHLESTPPETPERKATERRLHELEQHGAILLGEGEGPRVISAFAGLYAEPGISVGELIEAYTPDSAMRRFLEEVPGSEPNHYPASSIVKYMFTYYDCLNEGFRGYNPFGFCCLMSLYRKRDVQNGVPTRGARLHARVPGGMDPFYSLDRKRVQRVYLDFREFGQFQFFKEMFWPPAAQASDAGGPADDFSEPEW